MSDTRFSNEVFSKICERLANGESLRKICEDDDMPARVNFFRWIHKDEELRNQYARARDEQADAYADDCVYIADTEDDPQKARVRIDARKWHASKLRPKKYGESVRHKHGGDEDAPPISTVDVSKLNPTQLEALATIKLPTDRG